MLFPRYSIGNGGPVGGKTQYPYPSRSCIQWVFGPLNSEASRSFSFRRVTVKQSVGNTTCLGSCSRPGALGTRSLVGRLLEARVETSPFVRRGRVLLYDLYFWLLATSRSIGVQVKNRSSGGSQDERRLKSVLERRSLVLVISKD